MCMERKIIQVEERPPLALNIPLSIQHLFAMFGSTVLVPFLFNVSPTTCLFMNGIGTLLYLFITKGRIPSYLGSSFAFISPVLAIMATSSYHDAQSGFIVFGIIFILFSALIKATGTGWIDVIFPPACMGAIIAVIGLELAPTAASMAGLTGENINPDHIIVSMFTLCVTIIGSVAFRGFLAIIPVLFGVICGYILALFMGLVDLTPVINAPWFQLPHFYSPVFNLDAILIIAPAALVVLAEHIGHLVVTGNIVDRNLIKTRAFPVLSLQTAAPTFYPASSVQLLTLLTAKTSALWPLPRFTAYGLSAARQYLPFCFPSSASSPS